METEDSSFASAKLRDFVRGEVRENRDLYPHTGLVEPGSETAELLSFMESVYDASDGDELPARLEDSRAGRTLRRIAATDRVGGAVEDLPSFAVGITETEVDISPARVFSKLQSSLLNNHAPWIGVFFGPPNTGKTSLALLYLEVWREMVGLKYDREDPLILSNSSTIEAVDHVVTDVSEFRRLLFGDDEYFETNGRHGTPPEIEQERPVYWLFDECSTHMDARTSRREVAHQYTPLVKRFAKVRVDAAHIGHSGMDIHPELRRSTIATEFLFKWRKQVADVYVSMHEDQGVDKKYRLEGIPDTTIGYDRDDFAPWSWDEL